MVLGVALSIIVSALSYYSEKKLIQAEFNEAAENRYSALKRELDSNISVLASLQALYHTSGKDIERSEFRNFTSHILKRHASIKALSWIPRVPDSRREAYERAARREGLPDFQFTERIAQGKMKRAEKRREYFPVYFAEPYKGNEIAFGFDVASNPTPLEALEVSQKTGEIRASARIILLSETRSQFGFIVFAPIYKKGALMNSDQARWDNLEGFVLGVFRIGDIAEKAINYLKPEGVDFFIYDASAPEKERFLYAHSARTRRTPLLNQTQPETDVINSKTLEVAGRKWLVIYSATPDFIAARSSWRPWGLLLAGLAFTGFIAGFLVIVRHANHAEKSAKDLADLNTNLGHEIMERKRAEAALAAEKLFSDAIIDSIPGIFFVLDDRGNFLRWNKNLEIVGGYTAEELRGLTGLETIAEEDRALGAIGIREVCKKGYYTNILQVLTKDKRQIPFLLTGFAVLVGGKQYILGTGIDITEHKRAEEEKIHLQAQLMQAQKMEAVGLLAGGVAHDFNNILTAILGYGSMAQKRLKDDATMQRYIQVILDAAKRAEDLTKRLLAFSRKQAIEPVFADLNEIVRNIEKMLRRVMREDIELHTILSAGELPVLVDVGQMEQVLMNLAANARDAMPDGGHLVIQTDAVNVDSRYAEAHLFENMGIYAVLTVSDTGVGIDQGTKENIFEPFFTTKEVGKGTGLGLSMAYGIIRQHHGNINVYSEVGKGTTFSIYLPLAQPKKEAISKPIQTDLPAGEGETIIIAEDEPQVREIMMSILKDNGYKIIVVENGEDAVRQFRENRGAVSLVLLDVIMPVKNGRQAYEEIKCIAPGIKTIFMSGYNDDIISKKWILQEGLTFISKPINPGTLTRKIREVLNS
jgi:PAS domain S-box-containing protein